jgi:hypothetical protein
MFEDLMKEFNDQRSKLIDKLTLQLLKKAGIPLSEKYTNFELYMAMNDLKVEGFEITMKKSYKNKTWLCLYKKSYLVYGYEFNIRTEDNKIIMTAISIE